MGITFSHCDFGTSYSGFQDLRKRLAEEAGINPNVVNSGGDAARRADEAGKDPLYLFLRASDSVHEEGGIDPEWCASIARRIRALVQNWPDAPEGYLGSKGMMLAIASGLEEAARKKEKFQII